MRATFFIPIICVAGCATTEPKVTIQRVEIPVREACVPPTVPPAPSSYPDDALPTAPSAAPERYRLTAAANERRKARLAQIEPVIAACR